MLKLWTEEESGTRYHFRILCDGKGCITRTSGFRREPIDLDALKATMRLGNWEMFEDKAFCPRCRCRKENY